MGSIQISRERVSRTSFEIQTTEYGPERKEYEQSHWEAEEEPRVEADWMFLREIALPHAHQYEVHTCPRQGAHAAYGRRVCHPQHHRAAELPHRLRLRGPRREPLQDPRRHRHHHHRRRHVVHPHAHECRRRAYPQQKQRWVHWVAAEQHRYLLFKICLAVNFHFHVA